MTYLGDGLHIFGNGASSIEITTEEKVNSGVSGVILTPLQQLLLLEYLSKDKNMIFEAVVKNELKRAKDETAQ